MSCLGWEALCCLNPGIQTREGEMLIMDVNTAVLGSYFCLCYFNLVVCILGLKKWWKKSILTLDTWLFCSLWSVPGGSDWFICIPEEPDWLHCKWYLPVSLNCRPVPYKILGSYCFFWNHKLKVGIDQPSTGSGIPTWPSFWEPENKQSSLVHFANASFY